MDLNASDGGQRRYILVQLSEPIDHDQHTTIADVARERVRRAGSAIRGQSGLDTCAADFGFRAFRVDTTNMADSHTTADELGQVALASLIDSIKPDRTGEDLLFQVLLDWGLELSVPISVEHIDGREVHDVDDGALIACFAETVSPELIRAIAARQPLRAVFRDSAFASDSDRINADQVFAEVSPSTDVKTI